MARTAAGPALWVESGGSGSPTLLLLHGMGANAGVWEGLRPLIAQRWKTRWLAPDLSGHGRSAHQAPYSLGAHAADVARLFGQGEAVVVLGHSMGGAVAIALASQWLGVAVQRVLAFGVKLDWTSDEIAKAQEFARAPARRFATRDEAVERFLRVAGLKGLVGAESPAVSAGVVAEEGGFRLAADPRIGAAAPIDGMVAAMRAPLSLAAGERDPMVTAETMRRFDRNAAVLAGLGHNPHVEAPDRLWQWFEATLASPVPGRGSA
jgi:pimeloyl-ACP methyl ester carboxylesterase